MNGDDEEEPECGCGSSGWFGWWKNRLILADSIVFCERE
jgi:hypothetical protein